jgi:hypothetical protein
LTTKSDKRGNLRIIKNTNPKAKTQAEEKAGLRKTWAINGKNVRSGLSCFSATNPKINRSAVSTNKSIAEMIEQLRLAML